MKHQEIVQKISAILDIAPSNAASLIEVIREVILYDLQTSWCTEDGKLL